MCLSSLLTGDFLCGVQYWPTSQPKGASAPADEPDEQFEDVEDENKDCPANKLLEKVMTKLKVTRDADHVWGPSWRTRPDKAYFDLRG